MPDWVAITSVAASGSVAIAVPFIAARNERKRYEQQSLDARRDELRQLLDSSIQHLFKGYDILYLIGKEEYEQGAGRGSAEKQRRLGEELSDETRLIAEHGLRVGLRLRGDASLVQKQNEVNGIFLNYDFLFGEYLADPTGKRTFPASPHEKAFEGIRALREEIRAFLGVIAPLQISARKNARRRGSPKTSESG